jgi:SNF2 family DNA or RNA helicase
MLLNVGDRIDLKWTAEALRFATNRRRAKEVQADLSRKVRSICQGGRSVAEQFLSDMDNLGVLDDHQWVNVASMTLPNGYGLCLFDEQGSGKTVTLIFTFDVLVSRDEVDCVLIVAPKSMVPEWQTDFDRFTKGLYRSEILVGSAQEKRKTLSERADVLVTNFETAVTMEYELQNMLRSYQGRAMLVVDESFNIKNLDAKRTRSLRRLREWCDRSFVLCGTPAPNAPHDLIQQINLVDFGLTFDGIVIPEDRHEAQAIVQQAIEGQGIFVRHLKAEVLPNLPPRHFNLISVPLADEQQQLYINALQGLILDLRSSNDQTFQRELKSFLARRNALLQICSNPKSIVSSYVETPSKLNALEELLREMIGNRREKVIVWSFYTASLEAIFQRFSAYNPVRYDGSINDVRLRRDAVRRFQEDDTTMLFVGNPAAAGAGLTLHSARFAIYESMSNQSAHYLQSLDRIHRRGQTRTVEYYVLLCEKTIDVIEYERLMSKERSAQELLGDSTTPVLTRESMLEEAIGMMRLIEI